MTNPRSIHAMAVVGPSNRISARDVYSLHDSMSVYLGEGERKIKVEIRPVRGAVAVKKAPRRRKSR